MKTPGIITRPDITTRRRFQPTPPPEPGEASGPLWKKLMWFAGLCLAGSASVATVAYILRALPFGA